MEYFADNPGNQPSQPENVPIPLFGANMFETFYNELTNGMAYGDNSKMDSPVGISQYGAEIWNAMANFDLGANNHTSYYPYGGPDLSGTGDFWSNDFYMKLANGSVLNQNDNILSGWMKISSSKMAYLNMMRTLQTKKVLCTNMNFQWIDVKFSTNQMKSNPLTFFDQQIDGHVFINETSIQRYVNPMTNLQTNFGLRNNVDVPCDWIFSGSSGVCIGWDCLKYYYIDKNNQRPFNIVFTFQEIEA